MLQGGQNSANTALADTWEWDGTGWHTVTVGNPPARWVYSMAHDEVGHVTLFEGGNTPVQSGTSFQTGTWAYDGTTWFQANASVTAPPAQWGGSLVFDAVSGKVLLVGGYNGVALKETWVWSGQDWSPGPPLPAPRGWCGPTIRSSNGSPIRRRKCRAPRWRFPDCRRNRTAPTCLPT